MPLSGRHVGRGGRTICKADASKSWFLTILGIAPHGICIVKASNRVTFALLLAGAALLSGTAAVAQTKPAPVASKGTEVPFDRFTLPNGLTAIVRTDHSSPSVFVGIWYRTGSRDEPPGKTGFAHLFEHLMFQSTAHRPQEYMAALKQIGAIGANGVTRTDHTAYFETVPTNALDSALWLESDRMGYLDGGITQALLDEQRRVVLNEKRQGELRPEEMAWRHFLTAFYPADHPYAHPTIGSTADIEGATLDDVKQWFQSHYGAGNAVIVLSGDIDAATAREKITRYFGGIRAGTPISRPLQWVPSLTANRRDRLYGEFGKTSIARSWPVASDSGRDTTLLLLAARAMTGAPVAPLVKALVADAGVAMNVTATVSESELGSVLRVAMDVAHGVSVDRARAALDAAIAVYAEQGPPPERLRSIIAATDSVLLRALEDNGATGNWLGEGQVAHGDPAYFLRQRDWINAARPDEVRAVAARWLRKPYYDLETVPTPAPRAPGPDVDRSAMPSPGAFKTAITFPTVTTTTLANGMTLVVARRPGVAMVDLRLQFPTGTATDPNTPPAVAARAFDLLGKDARTASGEPVARSLSQLGVQLSSGAGEWASGVNWSVARDRLAPSFALVADILRRSTYPQAAVADANAAMRDAAQGYDRNPSAAAVPLLQRAIRGADDPRATLPTAQDSVTRAALVAFQQRHIVPAGTTLFLVGDVAPEQAKTLAERYFGDWRSAAPPPPPTTLSVASAPPRLILVDAPGAAQSSIAVGTVLPPFDPALNAAETLAAAAVADIGSGRLNANLRQAKGWTYGFGGGIDDAPIGNRLFVAQGTVQADRTAESLSELRREFADLAARRPITAAELELHRMAMIRTAALRFNRNDAFLNALVTSGTYRLPYDRATTAEQRLNAVTPQAVQALAARLFRPDAMTWVVIGDLTSIEPSIRALGLAPTEVWDIHGRKLR